jgi:hypothetical protein
MTAYPYLTAEDKGNIMNGRTVHWASDLCHDYELGDF